jgi:hypothetical protein
MTNALLTGRSQYWVSGYPRLAVEWDRERNGALSPDEVSAGSGRMIWWRCAAGPDHVWRAKPNNRSRGAGCPYCANKKVSATNSLATRFPRVAREWHPVKNGQVTAADVVASSSRVCWWVCSAAASHEWRASVRDRTRALTGCPYCAHKRVSVALSLACEHPDVAREWHRSRNGGLGPEDVSSGSGRVVWWQCRAVSGHCWRASVNNRVRRASGCPYCPRQPQPPTNKEPRAAS